MSVHWHHTKAWRIATGSTDGTVKVWDLGLSSSTSSTPKSEAFSVKAQPAMQEATCVVQAMGLVRWIY